LVIPVALEFAGMRPRIPAIPRVMLRCWTPRISKTRSQAAELHEFFRDDVPSTSMVIA